MITFIKIQKEGLHCGDKSIWKIGAKEFSEEMRLLWDQILLLGEVKSRKRGCSVEGNIIVWYER